MKSKTIKRALSLFLVVVLIAISTTTALADETTDSGLGYASGEVDVHGTFLPLTIYVSHPIIAEYCVTPDDGGFIGTEIPVTNLTKAPINVEITQFQSSYGSELHMSDVFPWEKNWDQLNLYESKEYIALGIGILDKTQWISEVNENVYYAANSQPALMGILGSNNTGVFGLVAEHGNAFDRQYTASHTLIFNFRVA